MAPQPLSRLILIGLSCASAFSGEIPGSIPALNEILDRMGQTRAENRAKFRAYSVTRDYKLFGKDREKPRSHVVVDVTFDPPGRKTFAIRPGTGGGLGERIVRQMLEGEAEAASQYAATDLSHNNYQFTFNRVDALDGQTCYVIDIAPKRKDRTLVKGAIWVDAKTYRLHRMEGEPGKAPSWWLRESRIAFSYADVAGMWLQIASESSANVRFFGPHVMVSKDVEYRIAGLPPR
jgi:hypothetical protein